MDSNKVGDPQWQPFIAPGGWGIEDICSFIEQNTPVLELNLCGIRISDEFAQKIAQSIQNNFVLKSLKFNTESQQAISFDTDALIKRLLLRNVNLPRDQSSLVQNANPQSIANWLRSNPMSQARKLEGAYPNQLFDLQKQLDDSEVPVVVRSCHSDGLWLLAANTSVIEKALHVLSRSKPLTPTPPNLFANSTLVAPTPSSPVHKPAPFPAVVSKPSSRRHPVDPNSTCQNTHHILVDGDTSWDCVLNHTDIRSNNNKFYLMQLLVPNEPDKQLSLFTRWGRVGEVGQRRSQKWETIEQAKASFMETFYVKTGNRWEDRKNFTPRPGKYSLLQMDYGDEEEESPPAPKQTTVPSTLDPHVQELLRVSFDTKTMEEVLCEMKFDSRKMPLGKLSKRSILMGYQCLRDIEVALTTNRSALMDLTCRFYTIIPHNFGRNRPPIIDSEFAIKSRAVLMQWLESAEIAMQLLRSTDDLPEAVPLLDRQYQQLHCQIEPMLRGSAEWLRIAQLVQSSTVKSLEPMYIFSLQREGEAPRFLYQVGNVKELWCMKQGWELADTLSQGLRVPPPEAPSSPFPPGKGLAFSDVPAPSPDYGDPSRCFLLLCDVVLGKEYECSSDQSITMAPPGFQSVLLSSTRLHIVHCVSQVQLKFLIILKSS